MRWLVVLLMASGCSLALDLPHRTPADGKIECPTAVPIVDGVGAAISGAIAVYAWRNLDADGYLLPGPRIIVAYPLGAALKDAEIAACLRK